MITPAETATALLLRFASPCGTSLSSKPAQSAQLVLDPSRFERAGTYVPAARIAETSARDSSMGHSLSTPLSPADRAVIQLIRMSRWDADWDSCGAAKPLNFSLQDAKVFVRLLAPESLLPRVALHADGHAILFAQGDGFYAEIEFLGNSRLSYYVQRESREWGEEIDFDGISLPNALLDIGFAVWRRNANVAA